MSSILELLDLLDTKDAMGCQKELVKKIMEDKQSEYLIELKGN